MAKTSLIQRNKKRIRMTAAQLAKRQGLKKIIYDKKLSLEKRFQAQLSLAKVPRNSSKTRIRNICELTGRSRGFYRDFKVSRVCLRELAAKGLLPGVKKASW